MKRKGSEINRVSEGDGSALALMGLHVGALFTQNAEGCLVKVNEEGGAAAPRFFLGRTVEGNQWWHRHDLHPALVRDLNRACESLQGSMEDPSRVADEALLLALLSRNGPVKKRWAGPAFVCPVDMSGETNAVAVSADNAAVLIPYLEAWQHDVHTGALIVAVLEQGKAVSLCASVRATVDAHEAGVETHPEFRGRGYGAQAVIAWARLVRERGCLPLYSTSWSNKPSRDLARKLGLAQFGSDLHIT